MTSDPTCETVSPRTPPAAAVIGAVLAMAVLTALTIAGEHLGNWTGWLPAFDIAIGAVSIALSPLLLRRPAPTALVLVALTMLSPAATPAAATGTLYAAQLSRLRAVVAVAAVGFASLAVQGLWRGHSGISFNWWLLMIAAAYAALVGWGRLARARRALIDSLRERARRAETEQERRMAEARMAERHRVAREMHDGLAHRLSLLATYAGALEYRPDVPPRRLAEAAGVIRAGAHEALTELREVITVLRADEHDRDGRPQPVFDDIARLVDESRDAGAAVELRDAVTGTGAVPETIGRTAYRLVQEGLTNARKHAAGQPVRVVLERESGDRLAVDISNPMPRNGDAASTAPGGGFGLIGMAERVQLQGGDLDHGEGPAGEFRLRAWLPLPT